MSPTEFSALHALHRHEVARGRALGAHASPRELALASGLVSREIGPTLGRLYKRKLVHRIPDPDAKPSRPTYLYRLTPRGRRIATA